MQYTFMLSNRKNKFGEYVVRCFLSGKRYQLGDYYTEDFQDAQQTKLLLERH